MANKNKRKEVDEKLLLNRLKKMKDERSTKFISNDFPIIRPSYKDVFVDKNFNRIQLKGSYSRKFSRVRKKGKKRLQ